MKVTDLSELRKNKKKIGADLIDSIIKLAEKKMDSDYTVFDIKVKLDVIKTYM